jgi:hypothetical protein
MKAKSNQSNDKLALTGIVSNNLNGLVRIYPNPANDIPNIDLNGLEKRETRIEIKNMLVQIVYQSNSLNQYLVINS